MTVTEAVWRAKATELFGADMANWRFLCPTCKRVSSIAESLKLPAEILARLRDGKWSIEQECIGRHVAGMGCNWCAYGLLHGPVFVVREDGHETPVFDFAGEPFSRVPPSNGGTQTGGAA